MFIITNAGNFVVIVSSKLPAFVYAGKFDETITRSGVMLFILKPKLRERKETNNS